MSKHRNYAELVFLTANAGFGPGRTYGWFLPQAEMLWPGDNSPQAKTRLLADNNPCTLECGDPRCRDWDDVFVLPGPDRTAALKALIRSDYQDCAYHVSECEMRDDQPADPPSRVKPPQAAPTTP